MIRLFLVIQTPDARHVRRMTMLFRSFDGGLLRLEGCHGMVGMVLNNKILDRTALRLSLGPWLDEHDCHSHLHSCGARFIAISDEVI